MAKKNADAPVIPVAEKYMDNDLGTPNTVAIRMYCIGTGDCFILKFYREDGMENSVKLTTPFQFKLTTCSG